MILHKNKRPWFQWAVVLLAGIAQAGSVAWPFQVHSDVPSWLDLRAGQPVWWLQLLSLGVLAWMLDDRRQSQRKLTGHAGTGNAQSAAILGWWFGTAWLAGTFWWTFVAMHTYGGLPSALAALAVLALAALLASYYAVVCGLYVAIAPGNRAWAALLFAALWLLAELARGIWLTGFGWGAVGYAHVDGLLAGFAPWVGGYGLCFIAAWLAMTLVGLVQGVRYRAWRDALAAAEVAAMLLMLPLGYQLVASEASTPAGRLSVTLLQGNIPQDEKFEPGSGVPVALQWYAQQLAASRTSLVVAPETAIPLLPQQLPAPYWGALQQRFAAGEQAALIGMPLGSFEEGYTNSVIGLKPGQSEPWRYDKHHLVPFGEFIPPFFKWFTELMHIPLGDFNRGALGQPAFEWHGQRLAANICVEDLYGEELGQLFADSDRAPTVFVNVSNLAWFGNSLAMDQHLQIARMRALEFERPFLLSTNTGVTAIIDYRGRTVSQAPRDTRTVLVGEVEGRNGITPYAWWLARLWLWPLWVGAAGLVLLALHQARRESRSEARKINRLRLNPRHF